MYIYKYIYLVDDNFQYYCRSKSTDNVQHLLSLLLIGSHLIRKKHVFCTYYVVESCFLIAEPTINTDIVELMSETNSSVISFSYTDNDNVFDSYCFTLVGGRTREKKCKNKTDSNRIVRYSGLYAGSVYTIVAVTNSVDMMSDPLRAYIMTGRVPTAFDGSVVIRCC